jgi:hypothetical protein
MKYLATYVLISFIGIAVLGFTGLITHGSLFSRCVEATIPGGLPCDGQDVSLNIVQAAVFQGFSLGLLVLTMMFASILVFFGRTATAQARARTISILSKLEAKTYPSRIKYSRWSEFCQQHPARV